MTARKFDRPALGNLSTPPQEVRYFDKFLTALEGALADIITVQTGQASQLADLTAAQADITTLQADMLTRITEIETAQAAADAAQADATTAQTSADTVHKNDAISASWTSPGVVLSASDAGANAKITVANHTRKYGDATSVSVTGADITALSFSTTYYVYYDDASRDGGAVTYHATTDPNDALPNAAAGRHFCGNVTTPVDGGAATGGGGGWGGGGVAGGLIP